ncbi:MAG: hypothetical protein R2822_07215 [Spirosomataceae bacterium]
MPKNTKFGIQELLPRIYSPNDNLTYHNLGAATLYTSITSNDQYQTGDALMGRINYNYNSRYYLSP